MQIGYSIIRALLDCSYKAWLLLKEGYESEPTIPAENLSVPDKIAIAAYYYEAFKPSKRIAQVENVVKQVNELSTAKVAPVFFQIPHCRVCPFREYCHQQLLQKDCISLLPGMSKATVEKYRAKGIMTIVQLSHLFKLRRRKRIPQVTGKFLYELKALAIREKKTYVLKAPELKGEAISIYIDFEGLPEQEFIYLIGVVIKEEGKDDQGYSWWADDKKDEAGIFESLIQLIEKYPEANLYHYGSYETKELKKKLGNAFSIIEPLMVNLLSYFRTHVYPPTYSNGLKEIAGLLGFAWTDKEASGFKSIEWRENWENTGGQKWKENLVIYNKEDCLALAKVHEWLIYLSAEGKKENVQPVAEMKKHSPWGLQDNSHFGEDFQTISKAAYFDYQQSKIYWRNGKTVKNKPKEKHKGRGQHIWQPTYVNEIIQISPLKRCPNCGHRKLYRWANQRRYKITDLKFTRRGIRQWVIEFHSGKGTCAKCRMKYNDSILRQLGYGDGVQAWAINLYVNYHVSFAKVSKLLKEQFGIYAGPTYFNDRSYAWFQKFKPEVHYCWQIIYNSPVIHIDETTVRLGKGKDKGYVWAFATPHTVFYHLTLTREAGFLKEWLKDYKGVIVSDFYPGYDSLDVKRQKCLIHLIRDLNEDLFKSPFDTEYKDLVVGFNLLMKGIVATIDKRGLKKYHLRKHIKQVESFYKKELEVDCISELRKKYAKRLKKQWDECWTFLHYDGLPWNNNNAERAIKGFVHHRRNVNGQFTDGGLKEYLSILTIAQTCQYRGLSFLDFMRGKVGLWEGVHADVLPGYLPYKQARVYVSRLKFRNKEAWWSWLGSLKKPSFIPGTPDVYYAESGWKGWEEWLGI